MSKKNEQNKEDKIISNLDFDFGNLDINQIFGSDIKNNTNEEEKENILINKSDKKEKIKRFTIDHLTDEEADEHIKNHNKINISNLDIMLELDLLKKIQEIYDIKGEGYLKILMTNSKLFRIREPAEVYEQMSELNRWRFYNDRNIYKDRYIKIANEEKMDFYKKGRLTQKYYMLNIDPIKKGLINDREYFTEELACRIVKDFSELEKTKLEARIFYDTIMNKNDDPKIDITKSTLYFNKKLREKLIIFINDNINEKNYYGEFIRKIFVMDEQQILKDYEINTYKVFYEDIRSKNRSLNEEKIKKIFMNCLGYEDKKIYELKAIRLYNIAHFKNFTYNLNLEAKYINKLKTKIEFYKQFNMDNDLLDISMEEEKMPFIENIKSKYPGLVKNDKNSEDKNETTDKNKPKQRSKSKDKSKGKNNAKTKGKKCLFEKIEDAKNDNNFKFKEINFDNNTIKLKDKQKSKNEVDIKNMLKKANQEDELKKDNK